MAMETMMPQSDEVWMDLALTIARRAVASGNTPVASVIVKDGVKVGEGDNRVRTQLDPILHAEVVAIQDSCARLGTADLAGATLYSTMEPCPMCAWATRSAGIRRVVLGARHADLQRTDLGRYSIETFMAMMAQEVELITGVRNPECVQLRRAWTEQTGRFA
jgi:tRNA(Arg) A34 adenosine deaminase TadA